MSPLSIPALENLKYLTKGKEIDLNGNSMIKTRMSYRRCWFKINP